MADGNNYTIDQAKALWQDAADPDLIPDMLEFIEPPQGDVIEKILRHCGLWFASTPRPPPDPQGLVYELDGVWEDPDAKGGRHMSDRESGDLTFVDEATFCATF
jgi:hypothetical protein